MLSRLAGQMAAIVKGLSCCEPGSSLELGRVDLNAALAEGLSPVIPAWHAEALRSGSIAGGMSPRSSRTLTLFVTL